MPGYWHPQQKCQGKPGPSSRFKLYLCAIQLLARADPCGCLRDAGTPDHGCREENPPCTSPARGITVGC